MNKERRIGLTKISMELVDIKERIKRIQKDEEWAFDNMPEGLQSSDRGEASEDAQDSIEEALDNLDGVIENLEDAANV